MGAVLKLPQCRLKIEIFPATSYCLPSTLRPSLILPFVIETVRPEQATPIDLKISIRKRDENQNKQMMRKKEKKEVKQRLRARL